jgi:hypothetical protein
MNLARRACPSCHHRLSPYTLECPVCGLGFGQRVLPRPLLFQASALRGATPPVAASQALRAPALGRVAPVQVGVPDSRPLPDPLAPVLAEGIDRNSLAAAQDPEAATSFWPLVVLEAVECLTVVVLNLVLAALVALTSSGSLARTYSELWPIVLPLHLVVTWAFFMIPMVLTGQTLLMAPRGIVLGSEQPERRIAYSLLHLLSVTAFPVSFLCLVLTRDHRTLAELLSGQEMLLRPVPRMKGGF